MPTINNSAWYFASSSAAASSPIYAFLTTSAATSESLISGFQYSAGSPPRVRGTGQFNYGPFGNQIPTSFRLDGQITNPPTLTLSAATAYSYSNLLSTSAGYIPTLGYSHMGFFLSDVYVKGTDPYICAFTTGSSGPTQIVGLWSARLSSGGPDLRGIYYNSTTAGLNFQQTITSYTDDQANIIGIDRNYKPFFWSGGPSLQVGTRTSGPGGNLNGALSVKGGYSQFNIRGFFWFKSNGTGLNYLRMGLSSYTIFIETSAPIPPNTSNFFADTSLSDTSNGGACFTANQKENEFGSIVPYGTSGYNTIWTQNRCYLLYANAGQQGPDKIDRVVSFPVNPSSGTLNKLVGAAQYYNSSTGLIYVCAVWYDGDSVASGFIVGLFTLDANSTTPRTSGPTFVRSFKCQISRAGQSVNAGYLGFAYNSGSVNYQASQVGGAAVSDPYFSFACSAQNTTTGELVNFSFVFPFSFTGNTTLTFRQGTASSYSLATVAAPTLSIGPSSGINSFSTLDQGTVNSASGKFSEPNNFGGSNPATSSVFAA